MAVGVAYNSLKKKLLQANINFESDTLKFALLANTYTPNIDTDEFFDDVSTHELATLGGYTAGGVTVAGKTVSQDSTNDEGVFDCTNPTWTADGTGFTARFAVLYKSTGDATTSPLIAYWDFGTDQTPVSVAFNLIINVAGLINVN